jgi:hypothetical protein
MTTPAGVWNVDHHVVPAGPRLVHFETMASPDDAGAEAAISALLRTFDGAREEPRSSMLRSVLFDGIAIGIATGLLVAWQGWRRRRRTGQSGPA